MLKFLHIENIAVVKSADIELGEGFTVLTGETGAGKSVIIDSAKCVRCVLKKVRAWLNMWRRQ